ncbi:hypothetical protein BLNAU_9284 [Blattamonas nauphoetae]|uniref:IPT/TIG domain-containing protein n=1 Tax=Blattamonas nauphoetae TaxID=2049346 RepID=A0ABQ9XW81_9EUKA|nr:hypothetical protein BLNAU_9284 [Blattamonas nauphoetae]
MGEGAAIKTIPSIQGRRQIEDESVCIQNQICLYTYPSNFTHFQLSFAGTNLPSTGTFTATPSVGSTFSVSFSGQVGVSDWVKGGGVGEMDFDTTYSLSSLIDADGEHIVLKATSFTTPEGPTLTKVSSKLKVGDPNSLTLTLTGKRMASGTFDLIVKESEQTNRMTIPVSVGTDATSGSGEVEVYNKTGTLEFGKTYTVEEMKNENVTVALLNVAHFLTPAAPARIESCLSTVPNDERTLVTITLAGVSLSSKAFQVVVERDGVVVTSPNNIDFISPTHITVDFPIGLTESSSTLEFGQEYTVKAVTDGADSFIVNPSLTITLPLPPIITSISTSRSPDCISVQFFFTGSNLPVAGVFTITLDTDHSFPVTFDSAGGHSPWLDITQPGSLPLAQTLSITSITPNDRLVLGVTSVNTPPKPSITSAEASISEESPDFIVLVVKGSNFAQKVWTLTTTAASGSLVIPVEFTTPTEGKATIEVYNETNTLQYGKNYSIDTLTLGPITVTDPYADGMFTTPNPPSRIESISTTLNADKTKAVVCFGGVGLEGGQWDVETDPPHQFTVDADLQPNGSILIELAVSTSNPSGLQFGQSYNLVLVDMNGASVHINSGLKVDVPPLPIVTGATFSFTDAKRTRCQITLHGAGLLLTGDYTVTVNDTITFTVGTWTATEGRSEEVEMGEEGLQYSSEYALTSIRKGDPPTDVVVLDGNVKFTTLGGLDEHVIFITSDGSTEISSCGGEENPCSTLFGGWSSREQTSQSQDLAILVRKEDRIGQEMRIGAESLVIRSETGRTSTLVVEREVRGEQGVLKLDGGSVSIESITIRLETDSTGTMSTSAFLVFGKGSFVLSSVVVESAGEGRVGKGLGWLREGQMEISNVRVSGLKTTQVVFGVESDSGNVVLDISKIVVRNSNTMNCSFIHFSSSSSSSSFSLANSRFLNTTRTSPSTAKQADAVVTLTTAQKSLLIKDLVFEQCEVLSSSSTVLGPSLSLTLSPSTPKPTITFSSCLFLDNLPSTSSTATLLLLTQATQPTIILTDCWFENTTPSRLWSSRVDGIAELDWDRLSQPPAQTATGAIIEFSSRQPTIIRRQCVFSSSSLIIQKSSLLRQIS